MERHLRNNSRSDREHSGSDSVDLQASVFVSKETTGAGEISIGLAVSAV